MNNCYKPTIIQRKVQEGGNLDDYEESGTRMDVPEQSLKKHPLQLRNVKLTVGNIASQTGSSLVQLGNTLILCTASGPKQRTDGSFREEGEIVCNFSFSSYSRGVLQDPRSSVNASKGLSAGIKSNQNPFEGEEIENASQVTQAISGSVQLHRLPKCIIELNITVLQDDGGILAASITAASLALANTGIEMYYLLPAVTLIDKKLENFKSVNGEQNVLEREASILTLDPTLQEEIHSNNSTMTIAINPSNMEVAQWSMSGSFGSIKLNEALEIATNACLAMHKLMVECLIG